jgi:hypothetical protein
LTAQRNEKNEHSFLILVMVDQDLNHIKLPASMVADLYHTSLIQMDETLVSKAVDANTETGPALLPDWKWLGENRKNILIIVNDEDAVHLPDNDLVF